MQEMTPAGVHEAHDSPEVHNHPEPRSYVAVAIFLAVVTAAEVGIYYVKMSDALLVTVLLVMAAVKFAFVASWFMHLRFDNRVFKRLFVTGIVLALIVFGIVLSTFFARGGPAPGFGS
ncbi:MAG TPA: cytochrome C oxidase subunit IV family protein [Actinomycetota bacterium]|nr:cytochrome C oxidase subunit IV family protein [Actinomycetota bacterium]